MKILVVLAIVILGLSGCKRSSGPVKKVDWSTSHLADIVETDAEDAIDIAKDVGNIAKDIKEAEEVWYCPV